MKRKVGIMGGSFDPIHIGHLVVANEALNIYKLDEIIFVPTGNPPHKEGLKADSFHRLLMVNMAVLSNNKFSVSDIEIKNPGKSYTLNTLIEFHKLYENAEFYFITGTDAIFNLPSWHRTEEILKLCRFIAASRPGISIEEVNKKINEIKEMFGGKIEILQIPMLQISSTDIRERVSMGISVKYLLPESVEQYIIKNELYKGMGTHLPEESLCSKSEGMSPNKGDTPPCLGRVSAGRRNVPVREPMRNEMYFEELKKKLEIEIGQKLFRHSIGTMEEAEKLASVYGCDMSKAKIAGLLHDCGKGTCKDNLKHAKKSAEIARLKFGVKDKDIINAIMYHTTGRVNMTLLGKIIFIADKIEPNRHYEGVEEIRKEAYTNIDAAIIKSLESTIEYVKNRNMVLDMESVNTLNYLKEGK